MFESLLGKPANGKCFSAIEHAVLDAAGQLLSEPFRSIYQEQLSLINEVQRFANAKESNFYTLKLFKPVPLPADLELPRLKEEYPLASVVLQGANNNYRARAKIFVVNGMVFNILFDKPPKPIEGDFRVVEAVLMNDPTAKQAPVSIPIDTAIPVEYFELLKADRTEINGWRLLKEANIREVVQEENNLYILAEKDAVGVICVVANDKTGRVVFVNFNTSDQSVVDGPLIKFLENTEVD